MSVFTVRWVVSFVWPQENESRKAYRKRLRSARIQHAKRERQRQRAAQRAGVSYVPMPLYPERGSRR